MKEEEPELKYTEIDGLSIAYQIWGSSEDVLIYVPGMVSHLEAALDAPEYVDWFKILSKKFKVIIFDKRGQGMSDRDTSVPGLEQRMDDITAITKAESLDRFYLFGASEGASISLIYAASNPQKVKAVAIFGGFARFTEATDYKLMPDEDTILKNFLPNWGKGELGNLFVPHRMPEIKKDMARLERMVCSPSTLESIIKTNSRIDIRGTLKDIKVPVLVMHSRDDRAISRHNGRYLADNIPNAKYIEYSNGGHFPWFNSKDNIIDDLLNFYFHDFSEHSDPSRNLSTIMFTDIKDSTKILSLLGDKGWNEKLNYHDAIMKNNIQKFQGKFIKNTGDGVLSVFNGPVRSIECAKECIKALKTINLDIRCSLHFGEINWRDNDIAGLAVNISARVLEIGDAGNVTITKALNDLIGGSKFQSKSLGNHHLKGIDNDLELFLIN